MAPLSAEALKRKLKRVHQWARYASGIPCRKPDFLIVGAQKCATTSLYAHLSQHPQVFPAIRKEVHFFETPTSRALGARWYRSFFPTESYLGLLEMMTGAAVLTGEATPYMPYARIPEMLYAINPSAKLVFLLRNPVDRAFSHYWHNRRGHLGLELHTFGEAIRIESRRIQSDLEAAELDEWHDDLTFRSFCYVHTGMYAAHLKRWLKFFPSESIYVNDFKKFSLEPAAVIGEICNFLKLRQHPIDCALQLNVGSYQEQMESADRDFLAAKFAEDRTELQKILGRDFGADWF